MKIVLPLALGAMFVFVSAAARAAENVTMSGLLPCGAVDPVVGDVLPSFLASGERHAMRFTVVQRGSSRVLDEVWTNVAAGWLLPGQGWGEQEVHVIYHFTCDAGGAVIRINTASIRARVAVAEVETFRVKVNPHPLTRYVLTAASQSMWMPRIVLINAAGKQAAELVMSPRDVPGESIKLTFATMFGIKPEEGEELLFIFPVTHPVTVEVIDPVLHLDEGRLR